MTHSYQAVYLKNSDYLQLIYFPNESKDAGLVQFKGYVKWMPQKAFWHSKRHQVSLTYFRANGSSGDRALLDPAWFLGIQVKMP